MVPRESPHIPATFVSPRKFVCPTSQAEAQEALNATVEGARRSEYAQLEAGNPKKVGGGGGAGVFA